MSTGVADAAALTFSGPVQAPTPARRRDDAVTDAHRTEDRRWMRPGWPLAAMFVPYPLWWALGTTDLALVVFAIPMAVWLLKRPRVLAPRGFGWWLLFLVWVVGGVVMLQVDAVGTVSDTHATRYLTWLYRLLIYLAATITTLYVVNLRRELSLVRVARIMSALFVTTVAGGLLGVVAPYFQFRSAMEFLLVFAGRVLNTPSLSALAYQPFVNKLIHPAASQVMSVLGFESPRPSAPYQYTNTWGLMFALTLPFFVYAWFGKTAGWRRWLAPLILAVGMVPAIYSVDRGMWAAVLVMVLFLGARLVVMGRPGLMMGVLAGAAVVVLVVAASPLGGIIQARFSNEGSVEGRTNLSTLAVTSVTQTAPLVGLGSTRNVQGNFHSISGGETASCPRCSPPAVGTQGQLWLVIFAQGLPGLAFFLLFFGRALVAGLRIRAPGATAATCVLVAGLVTFPAYNTIGAGIVVEMVAVAVIWREVMAHKGAAALPDTASYFGPLRRQLPVVLLCTALGLAGGAAWLQVRGVPLTATKTLLLSNSPRYPIPVDGPMSIDTSALLVRSAPVTKAVAHATGWQRPEVRARLAVTAAPNTRVLNLSLTGDRTRAVAGVEAAADMVLYRREMHLQRKQAAQTRILRAEAASLDSQLRLVDRALATLQRNGAKFGDTQVLRKERGAIITKIARVNSVLSRVLGAPITSGVQLRPTKVIVKTDVRTVALASGILVGFLVGIVMARRRERRGPRLATATDVVRLTGLPVIAGVTASRQGRRGLGWMRRGLPGSAMIPGPMECQQAALALELHRADALVPAEDDRRLSSLVGRLSESLTGAAGAPYYEARRVAIVASDTCHAADLRAVHRDLERSGTTVVGVVLWSRREASDKGHRIGLTRWDRGAFGVRQDLRVSRRG